MLPALFAPSRSAVRRRLAFALSIAVSCVAANPLIPPDYRERETAVLAAALDAWRGEGRPVMMTELARRSDRASALPAVMRYLQRVPPESHPHAFDFLAACGEEAAEAAQYVEPHSEGMVVLAAIDPERARAGIAKTLQEHRVTDRRPAAADGWAGGGSYVLWGAWFDDPKFFGALAGARALGSDGRSLAPALLPFVSDTDPYVRREVIEILAELGSAEPQVTDALEDAFRGDGIPEIRADALAALARLDFARAEPLIRDVIEGTETDGTGAGSRNESFARRCVTELAGIRPVLPELAPMLCVVPFASWSLDWSLTEMIRELKSEDSDLVLRAMVGNDSLVVRLRAADAMEDIAEGGAEEIPAVLFELLLALESDKNDRVAARAAEVRRSLISRAEQGEHERGLNDWIRDLAEDDIPRNAGRALSELSWRAWSGLPGALATAMSTGDDQQRRLAALILLERFPDAAPEGAMELAVEILALPDFPAAVRRAIRVLCMVPADPVRAEARVARLEEASIGDDPQAARLASLCLQFDPAYEPQPFQIALLGENLHSDAIPLNGTLALEIIERGDHPDRTALLYAYQSDPDFQASCLAAVGLLGLPDAAPAADLIASATGAILLRAGFGDRVFARADSRLRELRGSEKEALLEELFRDVDPRMRRWLAEILQADPGYRPSGAMIDHWISELRDDDVRWNASRAEDALRAHDSPGVRRRLLAALDSDDRQLRLTAERLLPPPEEDAACATPRRIEVLMENLDGDNDWGNARWKAAWLISNPAFGRDLLEAGLNSENDQRRWLSAWVLAVRGDPPQMPRVAEILIANLALDFSDSNAMMAVYGLARIGAPVRPWIEPLARDRDPQTAAAARMILDYLDGRSSEEIIARSEAAGIRLGAWAEDHTRNPPGSWSYLMEW